MVRCMTSTMLTGALLMASPLVANNASAQSTAQAAPHVRAVRIDVVAGSPFRRITLTERAAGRLGIETVKVADDAGGGRTVPYAAIIYDLSGAPYVYTNPEALTFLRHAIVVARIAGATAHLSEGPPVGTTIATTGVPQLYGAEKGVGH